MTIPTLSLQHRRPFITMEGENFESDVCWEGKEGISEREKERQRSGSHTYTHKRAMIQRSEAGGVGPGNGRRAGE